jgi:hypothetical protein
MSTVSYALAAVAVSAVILIVIERREANDKVATKVQRSVEHWERLRRTMRQNGGQ